MIKYCPECGKQVSTTAPACPHCGAKRGGGQPDPLKIIVGILCGVGLGIIVLLFLAKNLWLR
jgi:hypothetical protein